MNRKEYNGYTNYETWLVSLWLDISQGDQEMIQEWAMEALENTDGNEEKAVCVLADQIQDYIEQAQEDWMPENSGFFADLLDAAVSEVDWQDVAENRVADCMEEYKANHSDEEVTE